jgi:two-component system LytT family sensor kinase
VILRHTYHPSMTVSRPARQWMVAAAVATLALALLEAAQTWGRIGLQDPRGLSADLLPGIFVRSLRTWLVLGLLVPLPVLLARRFPPRRALLVHLAGTAAFGVLHAGLYAALLAGSAPAPYPVMVTKLLTAYLALDVLVYVGIVVAVDALRLAREAEAQRLHAAQLQATLGQARLDTLRARLNPHFLFNAMNALSTLALSGRGAEVAEGLSRLATLLRASLDEKLAGEIPLERELQLVETYLDVERLRFGDRLAVEHDVSDEARRALVPSLILQPLVENAVRHGVAARAQGGRVVVRGRALDGRLRLEVEDDGAGYAETSPQGLGLALVRERLQHMYPRDHALELAAREGGGTVVRLTLPRRGGGA